MATAPEIVTRIRSWSTSQDTTKLPDSELYSLMNEVARKVVEKHDKIWFCQDTGTTSTTAGTRTCSLPTGTATLGGLCRPTSARLTGSDSEAHRLPYLHYSEFESRHIVGTPLDLGDDSYEYTLWGSSIWVGPTPTSVFTITIDGIYYPQWLSDGVVDSNVFTVNAEELLLWGVLNELVLRKYEEDVRMDLFKGNFREALRSITGFTATRSRNARRARSRRKG